MENTFKFEANLYHNLVLKDRKNLEISGVKCIDRFDAQEFLIETNQGWMLVHGKELSLAKLDTENGDVIIKGMIHAIEYISNKKSNAGESIFSRLFK